MELSKIRREFGHADEVQGDFLLLLNAVDRFREVAEMIEMDLRKGMEASELSREIESLISVTVRLLIETFLYSGSENIRQCAIETIAQLMGSDELRTLADEIEKASALADSTLEDLEDHPF